MRSTQYSTTAREGVALLKSGCMALKYGKHGQPHATRFTLTPDDKMLKWEGAGLVGKLIPKGERRAIELATVTRLLVGRESQVFERFRGVVKDATKAGIPHLSISLKLDPSGGGRYGAGPYSRSSSSFSNDPLDRPSSARETLDVSFDDETVFGLWVAALRELIPPAALLPTEPLYGEGKRFGVPPPPPRPPEMDEEKPKSPPPPPPAPSASVSVSAPWDADPFGVPQAASAAHTPAAAPSTCGSAFSSAGPGWDDLFGAHGASTCAGDWQGAVSASGGQTRPLRPASLLDDLGRLDVSDSAQSPAATSSMSTPATAAVDLLGGPVFPPPNISSGRQDPFGDPWAGATTPAPPLSPLSSPTASASPVVFPEGGFGAQGAAWDASEASFTAPVDPFAAPPPPPTTLQSSRALIGESSDALIGFGEQPTAPTEWPPPASNPFG